MNKTKFQLFLCFVVWFQNCCLNCLLVEGQDKAFKDLEQFLQNELAKEAEIREERKSIGADLDLKTELANSRQSGLMFARTLIEGLDQIDESEFPGLAELYDFLSEDGRLPDPKTDVSEWADFDTNELIRDNPLFWKAVYESAPGDGVMEAIYASLLRAEGEALRSLQVSVIARLGRTNGPIHALHVGNIYGNQRVINAANSKINKGIELFDEGKLEDAAELFQQVIDVWPQNGLATFELGLTTHHLQAKAAGQPVPKFANLKDDDPRRPSDEVYELYRVARTHDPMIRNAYQGPEMSQKLVMMARVVLPAFRQLSDLSAKQIDAKQLAMFGVGSQSVGLHDYALFSFQVNAAARGRYVPDDLNVIKPSLSVLVDDKTLEEIVEFLSDKELKLHKFGISAADER